MIRSVTVTVERESIPMPSLGRHSPDPKWSETDPMGHVHVWVSDEIPTAHRIVADVEHSDMGDELEIIEYRCRRCGHKIEPRWKWESSGAVAHIPDHPVCVLKVETYEGTEYSLRLSDADYRRFRETAWDASGGFNPSTAHAFVEGLLARRSVA